MGAKLLPTDWPTDRKRYDLGGISCLFIVVGGAKPFLDKRFKCTES